MNFEYAELSETPLARYPIYNRSEGFHDMPNGERIFSISTPSVDLWATKGKRFCPEHRFGEV